MEWSMDRKRREAVRNLIASPISDIQAGQVPDAQHTSAHRQREGTRGPDDNGCRLDRRRWSADVRARANRPWQSSSMPLAAAEGEAQWYRPLRGAGRSIRSPEGPQ